jgi:ATP-dependent Lhr-like helicase
MLHMAQDAASELEFVTIPPSADAALSFLAEPVAHWFRQHIGTPTAAQRLAWPVVGTGKSLLLSAPTGTGKTLAAFLPIIGSLLFRAPTEGIRCLYVTPMKALGTDAHRNLRLCLRGIGAHLSQSERRLRVALRTGDTSVKARRQLPLKPPDTLLTTPESLAILLSQPVVAQRFRSLETVVVDEVHALAENKRGADLALSLERLTALTGERLQRIGLSATCTPLTEAARFLVGTSRPCTIAHVSDGSPLELRVELLETDGFFLRRLLERLHAEISANRSTLIFTNTRRLAERVSWGLRRRYPMWDGEIAVHHSALAASRRRDIERRFKRGRLRAVVSSTSLELGIDIGPVDGVVLVHPPGGVARLLQRIGRGGHGPGRPRRGLVLTAGPGSLFEAAVTAASGRSLQCEPLRVPEHPLDVLCQQLLGMAAVRSWSSAEAYALVRQAYPYRRLPRTDFEDCLDYLAGSSRLRRMGDTWTIRGERSARLLRMNIGNIIADEVCPVIIEEPFSARKAIGEVDEVFSDRLQSGDRFLFDGRCLEVRRRAHGALIVDEVLGCPAAPRWGGEGWPLSSELAQRLYLLRVQLAEALRDGRASFDELLRYDYQLDSRTAESLAALFERQEGISEMPDASSLFIEAVPRYHGTEYYVHTPLNRPANDAVARIAVLRLGRDHGASAMSLVTELGFLLVLRGPFEIGPDLWREILSAQRFDADLSAALAGSDPLRERFRRVALTGMLLLRNPLGREEGRKDWAEQRRFERIFANEPDFVLMRQARREAWAEPGEISAARAFLQRLSRLTIRSRQLAEISPLVETWGRIQHVMADTA